MIMYKNKEIKFRTVHNQKLTGILIDYNDEAVMVACDIGMFSIGYDQIIEECPFVPGEIQYIDVTIAPWSK